MITGVVFLMILAAVSIRGGDMKKLGELRPRWAWTVVASIAIQFVVITLIADRLPHAVASALHLGSYALALLFVWMNRRTTGIVLIVVGGLMNLAAIVANDGVMPATEAALDFAGKPISTGEFENSTSQDDANLVWLGDVFAFPEGMPFANVFSLGDIVLVIGGYVLVSRACMPKRTPDADPQVATTESESLRAENPVEPAEPDDGALWNAEAEPFTVAEPDTPAPGWYEDPSEPGVVRWWTGATFAAFCTIERPSGRRPGWYPDPEAPEVQRWWTGAAWTSFMTQPTPNQASTNARPG